MGIVTMIVHLILLQKVIVSDRAALARDRMAATVGPMCRLTTGYWGLIFIIYSNVESDRLWLFKITGGWCWGVLLAGLEVIIA